MNYVESWGIYILVTVTLQLASYYVTEPLMYVITPKYFICQAHPKMKSILQSVKIYLVLTTMKISINFSYPNLGLV